MRKLWSYMEYYMIPLSNSEKDHVYDFTEPSSVFICSPSPSGWYFKLWGTD